MRQMYYEFQSQIEPVPDKGGAYVRFPYDIREDICEKIGKQPGDTVKVTVKVVQL
jgi:hypothetical protein